LDGNCAADKEGCDGAERLIVKKLLVSFRAPEIVT
jgi:hypothetical protein